MPLSIPQILFYLAFLSFQRDLRPELPVGLDPAPHSVRQAEGVNAEAGVSGVHRLCLAM